MDTNNDRPDVRGGFARFLDFMYVPYTKEYIREGYPFGTDFHIPGIDLHIDIFDSWKNGGHPFNPDDVYDMKKLELWKSKSENEDYREAIRTWTDVDVRRRNMAGELHMNRLEIYSDTVEGCVEALDRYVGDLLVEWCSKSDFPGTAKWPAAHPIWDCSVSDMPTPRDAWGDVKYLRKAVKNMLYIIKKDYPDFRRKHVEEMLKCGLRNNHITSTTQRMLEMILNRFTIAKIAPKVTALSAPTFHKIIEESGVDLSSGAYLPMAGFGGIYEGVKRWASDHKTDVECECYDINPNFCNWYGWGRRDMLEQEVVTDKVCVVCPPFGKKYEQWKGTPREMSAGTSFFEWYWLIKKFVKAKDYIIVGPEVDLTGTGSNKGLDSKGKKRNGLFTKTVGVMLWTDEMMEQYRKHNKL
jgi:hypothetical protein